MFLAYVFGMLPASHLGHCFTSLLGRGQCGTDVAREGALQLVKAMEALNPTQEPAKQQGEALIQGDATECHRRCPVLITGG